MTISNACTGPAAKRPRLVSAATPETESDKSAAGGALTEQQEDGNSLACIGRIVSVKMADTGLGSSVIKLQLQV